jgi:hypothetical protein
MASASARQQQYDEEKAELLSPDSFEFEENDVGQSSSSSRTYAESNRSREDFEVDEKDVVEAQSKLDPNDPKVVRKKRVKLMMWMGLNTLATIAIVWIFLTAKLQTTEQSLT